MLKDKEEGFVMHKPRNDTDHAASVPECEGAGNEASGSVALASPGRNIPGIIGVIP